MSSNTKDCCETSRGGTGERARFLFKRIRLHQSRQWHDCDMVEVIKTFPDVLDDREDAEADNRRLARLCPHAPLCNGFRRGGAGSPIARKALALADLCAAIHAIGGT